VRRLKISCVAAIGLIGLLTSLSYGQIKWAQTGFNFLSISSDAKAAAMGDAVNSLFGYSGALFHNPATMAQMPTLFNADFSINSWIADIKYLEFSMIVSPYSGDYGVLGISLQSVDYGDVYGTMVANNSKGYVDTEIMTPSAMSVGIGYAKMISDRFAVGGQVRLAYQALGKSVVPSGSTLMTKRNVTNAVAYDFGTVFKTGVKSLAFGMSIRNFSKEVKFEEEGFQLPLLFTLGISANLFDFMHVSGPEQSLILSCDVTHPRSHPEQIKIGMEYQLLKVLTLRGGFISGDSEDDVTFGLGVTSAGLGISSLGNFRVDYSYTPFGVFDNVQRFTVSLSL
jgi:hypothetical protein